MSEEQNQQQFSIQKIYLKDVSFESPNAPQSFLSKEWQPQINVNLNVSNQQLNEGVYEVVLDVTVTAKQDDATIYLAELKQAGIFTIIGFPEDAVGGMLGAFCPETLFPFAREAVNSLISNGGFPQFMLAPVNFNAMYQDQLKKQQEAAQTAATDAAEPEATH